MSSSFEYICPASSVSRYLCIHPLDGVYTFILSPHSLSLSLSVTSISTLYHLLFHLLIHLPIHLHSLTSMTQQENFPSLFLPPSQTQLEHLHHFYPVHSSDGCHRCTFISANIHTSNTAKATTTSASLEPIYYVQ